MKGDEEEEEEDEDEDEDEVGRDRYVEEGSVNRVRYMGREGSRQGVLCRRDTTAWIIIATEPCTWITSYEV